MVDQNEPRPGARPWRRLMVARDPSAGHRPSTVLELLFDLCFVVAVAQAAAQLDHAVGAGHLGSGIAGYAMVFFAIWWAWMNFSWFASAYDTDDVPYRLLTLVQIAGVLVLAAGVPAAATHYDFRTITIGYVIMRIAMITQWLRAAYDYPPGRPAAIRYAIGIGACQIGWVVRLALPAPWSYVVFAVLVLVEIAVPLWAEFGGVPTAWHPGHINERYGLFTLIVLGESVSAATLAVQSAVSDHGLSASLLVIAGGALLLVFGLWWSYFKHEFTEGLRQSLVQSVIWGYSHYVVFAAVAALGAGLEVATQTAEHADSAGPVTAAYAVAVPVVLFVLVGALVHARMSEGMLIDMSYVVGAAVLLLVIAAGAALYGLAAAIMAMGIVVGALVALNVVLAHRASATPAESG